MEAISIEDVLKFIQGNFGKIFSIKFIKRSDGTIREMVCRQGVKKHLAQDPSKPGLDFKSYKLIPVFDMQKQDYRSIPVEGIIEIKIDGEWKAVSK